MTRVFLSRGDGPMGAVVLNEPDRHRVAREFSIAGLDGGDDDEDGVQDPKNRQEIMPTILSAYPAY